jgi:5-methylcytosine-specific restriction protein A
MVKDRKIMNYFVPDVPEKEIRKEKQKARDLRKTQWWKRRCSEGKCYYCGREVPPKELTMDHIVPIIRGGRSTRNNVVPACKDCNNKKKYSLPMEWEEYLDTLKKKDID